VRASLTSAVPRVLRAGLPRRRGVERADDDDAASSWDRSRGLFAVGMAARHARLPRTTVFPARIAPGTARVRASSRDGAVEARRKVTPRSVRFRPISPPRAAASSTDVLAEKIARGARTLSLADRGPLRALPDGARRARRARASHLRAFRRKITSRAADF